MAKLVGAIEYNCYFTILCTKLRHKRPLSRTSYIFFAFLLIVTRLGINISRTVQMTKKCVYFNIVCSKLRHKNELEHFISTCLIIRRAVGQFSNQSFHIVRIDNKQDITPTKDVSMNSQINMVLFKRFVRSFLRLMKIYMLFQVHTYQSNFSW